MITQRFTDLGMCFGFNLNSTLQSETAGMRIHLLTTALIYVYGLIN